MVAARGEGKGNGDLLLNMYRVSDLQDEKIMEIGCTIICMLLILLNYTIKMVKFMLCPFLTTIKKEKKEVVKSIRMLSAFAEGDGG